MLFNSMLLEAEGRGINLNSYAISIRTMGLPESEVADDHWEAVVGAEVLMGIRSQCTVSLGYSLHGTGPFWNAGHIICSF